MFKSQSISLFAAAIVSVVFNSTLFLATAGAFEALPKKVPELKDNPTTPAKIELGKQLFFDPRLSKNQSISCNSCHNVMSGGTDNLRVSFGINSLQGGRSSPTVWNAAFLSVQFWDGRAASLEEQAKGPLINPVEMGMENHNVAVNRVSQIEGYRKQFKAVFGEKDPISIDNVVKAIAAYERTLITPNSPFDKFLGGNKKALSASAQRGMKLVQTVGCISCHSGPLFAGPQLPQGQGFYMKFPVYPGSEFEKKYELTKDVGRSGVTKNEAEKNLWRVPTWRNIALTAPYFHNGSVNTLDEAVRVMAKTQLNKDLENADVHDIVDFLKSLTGEFPKQVMPRLPETPGTSFVE